jgi:hypothetical protein
VIVKRIHDSIKLEAARAAIIREFESLQIVRNYLPPHLLETVPRPLMVLPDSKALVSEALSGKPLSHILKLEANRFIGPLRGSRMLALGQLTGRWLSELHQATRIKPLPHDSAAFLGDLERRLICCARVGVTADAINGLRLLMSRASHQMEGHLMPAAARQGDFIPQNILVDGSRLAVVDFESFCQSESVYEDVATFVAYLQALSAFPYYSQRALRRLSGSFLQTYGLTGDEAPLRLYLARSLVVLISEIDIGRAVLYGRRKRLSILQAQLQRVCRELPSAARA